MPEYYASGLSIVVGLAVLLAGGELLVRGASGLATSFQIAPLVIGLTVVAFGTSAPELAVVVQSSFAGQSDLGVGNVVGSCIFNVLFVLGLTAIVSPLVVSARLVRLEIPLMVVTSLAVLLLGLDGSLSRLDGLLLTGGLVAYIAWTVVQSRKEGKAFQGGMQGVIEARAGAVARANAWTLFVQLALIVAGLALLVYGSDRLVEGSVAIAEALGVSKLIIGLTIVAVGTSLPEIVTSVLATIRGHGDIAVGNIVGSNILNILCVLGVSSLIAPSGIAVAREALHLDIPVMIAVSVACLPIFFTDYRIDRWEGYLFFGYYVAYTAYLVLDATHPAVGRQFGQILLFYVMPLTAVTLLVGVVRCLPARLRRTRPLAWLGGPVGPDSVAPPSKEERA